MSKVRSPDPATTLTPVTETTRPPGPLRVTSPAVKLEGDTAWSNVTRTDETELAVGRVGVALTIFGAAAGAAPSWNVVWYGAILLPDRSVTFGPIFSV